MWKREGVGVKYAREVFCVLCVCICVERVCVEEGRGRGHICQGSFYFLFFIFYFFECVECSMWLREGVGGKHVREGRRKFVRNWRQRPIVNAAEHQYKGGKKEKKFETLGKGLSSMRNLISQINFDEYY